MMFRDVMVLTVLVLSSTTFAEDEAQRRAREELEKQLTQMVGTAPSRIRVEFQPLDDPNFQVEELELSVDGKALKAPTSAAISSWTQEGPMPVGVLDVTPGRHKVSAKVTYHNTASAMVSDEGDHRWKVVGDVGFEVNIGIEVKVMVTATRDAKQPDVAKRIKLNFPSQPSMISKLDDGTMPEPSKLKPAPLVQNVVSAKQLSANAAAEDRKRRDEQAKLTKTAAVEERKRKLDEAKLAKAAAAEERKRKREEARLAKVEAAEEKKRKAAQAKLALVQATDGTKRQNEEESLAPLKSDVPVEPGAVDAGAVMTQIPEVVDGGSAIAALEERPPERLDAGVAVVAKVEPPAEEEGGPWMLVGGGSLLMVLGALVYLVRRSGRVPEIRD
jgi:hypothetical protein